MHDMKGTTREGVFLLHSSFVYASEARQDHGRCEEPLWDVPFIYDGLHTFAQNVSGRSDQSAVQETQLEGRSAEAI